MLVCKMQMKEMSNFKETDFPRIITHNSCYKPGFLFALSVYFATAVPNSASKDLISMRKAETVKLVKKPSVCGVGSFCLLSLRIIEYISQLSHSMPLMTFPPYIIHFYFHNL